MAKGNRKKQKNERYKTVRIAIKNNKELIKSKFDAFKDEALQKKGQESIGPGEMKEQVILFLQKEGKINKAWSFTSKEIMQNIWTGLRSDSNSIYNELNTSLKDALSPERATNIPGVGVPAQVVKPPAQIKVDVAAASKKTDETAVLTSTSVDVAAASTKKEDEPTKVSGSSIPLGDYNASAAEEKESDSLYNAGETVGKNFKISKDESKPGLWQQFKDFIKYLINSALKLLGLNNSSEFSRQDSPEKRGLDHTSSDTSDNLTPPGVTHRSSFEVGDGSPKAASRRTPSD